MAIYKSLSVLFTGKNYAEITGRGYFPTDEKDFGHKGFNLKLVGAGRGGWGRVRQTLDVVQNAPNQDRGW